MTGFLVYKIRMDVKLSPLRHAALPLIAGAVLSGCAGGFEFPLKKTDAPPAIGVKVEPALAGALETAAAGTVVNYRKPDGTEVVLTLAAPYESANGQNCRVGRDTRHWAYGFCRTGSDWYAVPPAVVREN